MEPTNILHKTEGYETFQTSVRDFKSTRAYVKRRGPRRKGVKYGCNSL